MDNTAFRFAISATFTAEPLQAIFTFWGRRLNAEFEARFAPYNQLLQTLLDPTGEFASNQHGVNVLLARVEDLAEDAARLDANLHSLVVALREAPVRMSAPVIFVLCPPSPARAAMAHDAAARLAASLEDVPGVQFISFEQIARLYPVAEPHSPQGERLGGIPYTELYFCALGTAIVRHAHALSSPPYKVIALDCDNTLWQGICGEDGPHGVVVDPGRRALQQFMVEQREAGLLLVLASKNNESDVLETFQCQAGMPLQLRHFVTWRLNWDSKAVNLAAMADELLLGLDSFIFVDDNPKECAEMEQSLPEVLSLALPEDPAEIPHFLDHVWAFDHPTVTEEDRHRNAYYTQSQEFGRELRASTNLSDFMRSLELQVRIEPLRHDRLPRVAQLTQRTNQFNFTTLRRSEADLQALLRDQNYECRTVEVTDRFGAYGLVGVIIFRETAEALEIDTMLLSCRALGRGVEHRMLAWLGEEAGKRGRARVDARLQSTSKNQPARQFLREAGSAFERATDTGFEYHFDAQPLAGLEWQPPTAAAVSKAAVRRGDPRPRRFVELVANARELSTAAQVLEAMRAEARRAGAPDPALDETEAKLAAIWSELLHVDRIQPDDGFFDLGGHSLLAVLLIMRVREAFGVELPIDDVYSATLTLGELARKIEVYQLGVAGSAEYEALLNEIENMSDEEVTRLLAEEDPGALRS